MRTTRDKQKNALDRYGNLRIRERHGDRRERSKSRSPSVDSDPDHKYYSGNLKKFYLQYQSYLYIFFVISVL